jgi:hypothetical protein
MKKRRDKIRSKGFRMHQHGDVSAIRINKLIKALEIKSYLEIGIADGKTFQEVDVLNKIGCDPHPVMNKSNREYFLEKRIFRCTSDEFFKMHMINKFGLIYIDGLHTARQVAKDFVNSLKFTTENSIWLIDDVFPDSKTSEKTSLVKYRLGRLVDLSKNLILKKSLNLRVGWQGDVWKLIKAISSLEQFKVITIVVNNEKIQSIVIVNSKRLKEIGIEFPANSKLILEQLNVVINAENCSIRKYLDTESNFWNEELEKIKLPKFYNPVDTFDEQQVIEFLQDMS